MSQRDSVPDQSGTGKTQAYGGGCTCDCHMRDKQGCSRCDHSKEVSMPDPVREALDRICIAVNEIGEACEDYGGWAGEDTDAKIAMDLGHDLLSMGFVVGLHGREYAERGQ